MTHTTPALLFFFFFHVEENDDEPGVIVDSKKCATMEVYCGTSSDGVQRKTELLDSVRSVPPLS